MDNLTIGILAHVDAGKTTLIEALLYLSGAIRKPGRVDHKNSYLDNNALERKRGITIFSKQAVFLKGQRRITLMDTPGHTDFSAEMERTLQVLDYAILVVSGTDGVQGHTATLWKLLSMYDIPVFLFINKMDQPDTDRDRLLAALKKELSDGCLDFGDPESSSFMEEAALYDESLLDYYLEHDRVRTEDIRRLIRERILFPCYFGSALRMSGVEDLLMAIEQYMEPVSRPEEFGARVYKIARDERGERLTFLKVTGGEIRPRQLIDGKDKINQIRLYSGAGYELAGSAPAGTVCAVTGFSGSFAGQGLGYEKRAGAPVLEPVLFYRLILPDGIDMTKTIKQLRQLEEEEPLLHISWNPASGEVCAALMGDIQTEIIKSLIYDRFGLSVEFGPGNIVYRETVMEPVIGLGHYEPLRHYAEVHVRIDPLPTGSGMDYATECSEDILDRNWQRLILTHFQERDHPGVLTGSPLTDVRLTLVAGRAHQKHTEGGDFRQATYRAIRQGLKSGRSLLLEPWYDYLLELPSDHIGRAMSDIRRMDGTIEGPREGGDGSHLIMTGKAPASEMNGYQQEVLSYSGGKGKLTLRFRAYEACHNEAEVLEEFAYDSERDLDNPSSSVFCAHGAGFLVPWDQVREYVHIKDDPASRGNGIEDPLFRGANEAGRDKKCMEKRPASGYNSSGGEDAAFAAIYEREFGTEKQRQDRYSGFRRKTSEKRPSLREDLTDDRLSAGRHIKKAPVKKDFLLVDGYNVIYAWEELKGLSDDSLDAARMKLADILCNYQAFVGCTLILVFDAYKVKGNKGEVVRYNNIYIVYTKEAETADQYIEKTTHEIGRKHNVTVATSDATEQVIVMGQGAKRMSSRDLHEEVERVEEEIRAMKGSGVSGKNYLFDQTDQEIRAFLEEVRLGRSIFDV